MCANKAITAKKVGTLHAGEVDIEGKVGKSRAGQLSLFLDAYRNIGRIFSLLPSQLTFSPSLAC